MMAEDGKSLSGAGENPTEDSVSGSDGQQKASGFSSHPTSDILPNGQESSYPVDTLPQGKLMLSVPGTAESSGVVGRRGSKSSPPQDEVAIVGERSERAKTPFGLNRHMLVVFFLLYTFMTGSCYWGWNYLQDMLYKSGAFAWSCEGKETDTIPIHGKDYTTCAGRRENIADMYVTAFACHFGFSALAGIILDVTGPKFCSLIGLSTTAIGWIMLGLAGKSAPGLYYAAFAFIGAGTDTGYFPLLSVSNLFPGNESLVLSILGSVRSCSFAIPAILDSFYRSDSYEPSEFSKFCFGYVGVGVGLSMIISVAFVPFKPFKVAGKSDEEAKQPVEQEAAARGRRMSVYTGSMMPPVSTSARDLRDVVDELSGHPPDYRERRTSYMLETGQRRTSVMAAAELERSGVQEASEEYPTYLSNLKRPEYTLIVPFFCLCLVRGEFFSKSNKELLITSRKEDPTGLFGIFNILSFLPGPIFGKLCDTIGVLWVIFILNLSAVFAYVFVIFDVYACKIIAILFFFVYTSFVLSNLYCYVADIFPSEHFGKLTGLASFIGGMFSLSSIGFYRMCTQKTFDYLGAYKCAPVVSIMIVFGIVNIGLWLLMKWFERRRQRERKALEHKLFDVAAAPSDRRGSAELAYGHEPDKLG